MGTRVCPWFLYVRFFFFQHSVRARNVRFFFSAVVRRVEYVFARCALLSLPPGHVLVVRDKRRGARIPMRTPDMFPVSHIEQRCARRMCGDMVWSDYLSGRLQLAICETNAGRHNILDWLHVSRLLQGSKNGWILDKKLVHLYVL